MTHSQTFQRCFSSSMHLQVATKSVSGCFMVNTWYCSVMEHANSCLVVQLNTAHQFIQVNAGALLLRLHEAAFMPSVVSSDSTSKTIAFLSFRAIKALSGLPQMTMSDPCVRSLVPSSSSSALSTASTATRAVMGRARLVVMDCSDGEWRAVAGRAVRGRVDESRSAVAGLIAAVVGRANAVVGRFPDLGRPAMSVVSTVDA